MIRFLMFEYLKCSSVHFKPVSVRQLSVKVGVTEGPTSMAGVSDEKFVKLKLIKAYLRYTMADDMLS